MACYGCRTTMHLVRLLAPRLDSEDHTKDIDPRRRHLHTVAGGLRRHTASTQAEAVATRFDPVQPDVAVLGNLVHGALFFASTSILILGGLFALLGTTQRVIEVVAELPFTGPFPVWLWEAKALLLI
jgi:uncharacterized protein DUF599